jgi:hypothetical protein
MKTSSDKSIPIKDRSEARANVSYIIVKSAAPVKKEKPDGETLPSE